MLFLPGVGGALSPLVRGLKVVNPPSPDQFHSQEDAQVIDPSSHQRGPQKLTDMLFKQPSDGNRPVPIARKGPILQP